MASPGQKFALDFFISSISTFSFCRMSLWKQMIYRIRKLAFLVLNHHDHGGYLQNLPTTFTKFKVLLIIFMSARDWMIQTRTNKSVTLEVRWEWFVLRGLMEGCARMVIFAIVHIKDIDRKRSLSSMWKVPEFSHEEHILSIPGVKFFVYWPISMCRLWLIIQSLDPVNIVCFLQVLNFPLSGVTA